ASAFSLIKSFISVKVSYKLKIIFSKFGKLEYRGVLNVSTIMRNATKVIIKTIVYDKKLPKVKFECFLYLVSS
ncbi:MAG: hypothetical protein VW578_07825, partial [Flavobacteriaceae bacterium]